jgi:peptidoglycan/LPS O-acetylase OafA/YrhL
MLVRMQNKSGEIQDSTPSRRINALPALDGLRGYASCIVFIFHSVWAYSPMVYYGYGFQNNRWLHQLPFFRLIYAGYTMVFLFYIVSGYVLSVKLLRLVRNGSWDQAFHTLSSSVFRRGLRLFMPAIISTFITVLLLRAGMFQYVRTKIAENAGSRLSHFELPVQRFDTFQEQFQHWRSSTWKMMNPLTWERYDNPYNSHLWTLSVEFRSSCLLFLVFLALARLTTCFRLFIVSCLVWNFALYQKWEMALTLSGMFLAEMDLVSGTSLEVVNGKPIDVENRPRPWKARLAQLLIFIFGLYLASYPKFGGNQTTGFRALSNLTPDGFDRAKWWQSIGCLMTVWSVNNSQDIQPIFTNPLAQYLGDISFSIYIVHGPVLHSLGLVAMASSWKYTGKDTVVQKCLSFIVAAAIVLPAIFGIADIFRRVVDVPCAEISKWVEKRLLSDGPTEYQRDRALHRCQSSQSAGGQFVE